MTMPNFLIIGAARSGTTSLYNYLKQHPQIYMCPIKEPTFFLCDRDGIESELERPEFKEIKRLIEKKTRRTKITDIETYQTLFQGVTDETAIGEASPDYLWIPRAVKRIRHYIPRAKLIAILRDPVERAYSDYLGRVADLRWPLEDFAQISTRIQESKNWWTTPRHAYIVAGFYHAHLKRYFDIFDRDQIKVYLYKDLKANNIRILQDIFQFLDVDVLFVPDVSIKYSPTGIPRNRFVHDLIRKRNPIRTFFKPFVPTVLRQYIAKLKSSNLIRPQLAPEVRQELLTLYQDDILKLQDLIERDLSAWLE